MIRAGLQAAGALGSGLLFGVGLVLSGMTEPRKIIAFLDVFGSWDPSLLLVMAAAVGTHFTLLSLTRRRTRTLTGDELVPPTPSPINGRLLAGAAIFGVGWGLGGYCPGPSLVALASGALPVFVFVAAMLLGIAGARRFLSASPPAADEAADAPRTA